MTAKSQMLSVAIQNTSAITGHMAVKVYSDTKPNNMKTADLQKGIILLHNGVEVIGEGTGFGVPIAKYSDETVFSGSSFLEFHEEENNVVIRKDFSMDRIARDKFRNLKLENKQLRTTIDFVSMLYQKHRRVAQSILLTKEFLFKFGVKSIFAKINPKGKITVTYTVTKNLIKVNMNFSQLDRRNLQKIFVLNEQGASFFRKYSDSNNLNLIDDEIGFWDSVTAQSAKISDKQERVSFKLKSVEGAVLRRGREFMEGSLDWIGLDYELDSQRDSVDYEIEVFG